MIERPSAIAAITSARNSIIAAAVGSCTCMVKTPDAAHHAADCRYLKLASALDHLDEADAALATLDGDHA